MKTDHKWIQASYNLGQSTSSAAKSETQVIYPVGSTAIPEPIRKMPGLVSCFISTYTSQVVANANVSVVGELLAVRTDGGTTKNYLYPLGVSNDGASCFAGPYKRFDGHHMTNYSANMPMVSFFGNTHLSSK